MAEIHRGQSSITSQWPTHISTDLGITIESRLIGIVEDQHRQQAVRILLEYLHSSMNALANTCNFVIEINSPNKLSVFGQEDVYEIYEIRMLLGKNKHNTDMNTDIVLDKEQHNLISLVKQISICLDLLIWLIKYLWSDSYFISGYANVGDKYLNRENIIPYSKQWLGLLQIMAISLDEAKRMVENISGINDIIHGTGINKSLLQLSEILKALLRGRNQPGIIAALIDKEIQCQIGGDITDMMTGHLTMVEERLEGYEDLFSVILTNPICSQNADWLPFLERNEELLINSRLLLSLHEVALQQNQSIIKLRPRLLKLSLRCLSQLPLPIFMNIHEWLWSTPERYKLYMSESYDDWDLSLNQTFNKLTNSDRSKLAVQVGCLLLQKPEATLERALQHVTQNQEAVKTLSEVVQCLPLVKESGLPGKENSLLFSAISEYLLVNTWTKMEETNIINFTVNLCQESVFYDCPVMQPPVLSCDQLLLELVLQSLTSGCNTDTSTLMPPKSSDTPTLNPLKDTDIPTLMPLERSLKLLNGLLQSALQYISEKLLYACLMCLCELLESYSKQWSLVRDLCIEDLQLVCLGITSTTTNADINVMLMWKSLSEFHWSTKLKVAFELKSLAPYLKIYYEDCLDAVRLQLRSLSSLEDQLTKEEELSVWDTILQASSTSDGVAQMCSEIITDEILSPTSGYPPNHRSLTVALACHLEQCTTVEWKHTLVTLRSLLSTVSMVPYSSQFTGYVPLNIHNISGALQLSQMMLSVLEIKSLLKTNYWEHIIKCYLIAMQEMLRLMRDVCFDDHARLFLTGQVFCHACAALDLIPIKNHEALVVLVYEVLGQLEDQKRSKVTQWHLIYADMIMAARSSLDIPEDRDILVKKVQDLI